jgi:putative ABC transport system permease protein
MSLNHDLATGWMLASAALKARAGSSALTVLLFALGVATIVALMLVNHQLETKSEKDNAGIDLVVGAKGSPLQLVLSSVYHVDIPTGNISGEDAQRIAQLPIVKQAVPLALGDSFRRFRIVGTDARFETLYGLRIASGARATQPMQAMLGAAAARESGLTLGSTFAGNHGLSESGGAHGEASFVVTGIFAPTGSVADRLILTPIESVWHLHPEPAKHAKHEPHDHADEAEHSREITALLVQYASPLAAARLPREINAMSALQAASPAQEMTRLFGFLGIGIGVLRALAAGVVLLAAASVFAALSAAMADRRADLHLLRVLGAPRGVVFASVLLQGAVIGLMGVILGLLLGHLAVEGLGAWMARPQGIGIGGWAWVHGEAWVFAGALALAAAAAIIPAWRAYRTNLPAGLAAT